MCGILCAALTLLSPLTLTDYVQLSWVSCPIFQWDKADLTLLKKAKKNEMLKDHIVDPSEQDIIRRLTRKELALHCRRSTRGTEDNKIALRPIHYV